MFGPFFWSWMRAWCRPGMSASCSLKATIRTCIECPVPALRIRCCTREAEEPDRQEKAYSVEKLYHAKTNSETWSTVLDISQSENVFSRMAL
jgi:hypothetical protein